ncbi:FecCD family ABC transporter permease [Foetidibacter luteolus]|uniref:FecCD family ABC transporter permease n=1 Tax=Foetidibacter luteolus TaxID=2608880 RepID=UPI00129A6471|nr:iron ABC transporter permease [Foetidibacter luteolus]
MQQFSKHYTAIYPVLVALLIITTLFSIRYGAVNIPVQTMYTALGKAFSNAGNATLYERIFMEIRLPRALLTVLVGASLAAGGVLMQALFRNPIVEPGLVGTSSGAAFGAALYFVLGATFHFTAGEWTLPLAACAGAVIATGLVFILSESGAQKNSVTGLLLTGIAINALFISGVGFMSYIARDPQARSITFWTLGTLSGGSWHAVAIVFVSSLTCIGIALRYSKQLNLLMIGEDEAQYMGVNTKNMRRAILLVNVIMVATATAFTGVISFVGLIVPHLLRMLKGSDNRFLLIAGSLCGGLLLSLADIAARMLVQPAELPIGIVTSVVGVPVFILLLKRKSRQYQ